MSEVDASNGAGAAATSDAADTSNTGDQSSNGTDDEEDTSHVDETTNDDTGADDASADDSNGDATDPSKQQQTDAKAEAAKSEEQKRHDNEMAQARMQERQALKSVTNQYVEQARQAVEAAGDDEVKRELAEIRLGNAQRDAQDFVREVEVNQSVMRNDYSRAAREIDLFNPDKNPESASQAMDLAIEHLAPYLDTEVVALDDGTQTEVILGSRVNVFQFLQNEANALGQFMQVGARQGQQDEARMRSRAENGGGSTARETPFSKLSTKEMREKLKNKGYDLK
jgi:hypothetical protein